MVHSDDRGLVLPPKIASKQVVIVPIKDTDEVMEKANYYANLLNDKGIVTYIDNSNKSAGFRFAEAEVNGIPVRMEIGPRDLEQGQVTLARRDTGDKIQVSINDDMVSTVSKLLDDIQNNLYNRALERQNKMIYTDKDMEEVKKIMNTQPGFMKAMWCGSEECELKMKEIKGLKSRCIPFEDEQEHISDTCVCCGKKAKEMVVWGIQY